MISQPNNGAALQAYLAQLMQTQGGLKSMPLRNQDGSGITPPTTPGAPGASTTTGTPFENGGLGTLRGGTPVPTPPPTDPNTLRTSVPGGAPGTPPPNVPQSTQVSLPTSVLGSGQTYTPTDWMQSGFQQAYNQNNANGIAAPPSNFARWQTYPASPALNRGYVPLGGAVGGGAPGSGMGGAVGGQPGGSSGAPAPQGGGVPGIPGATVSHSDPGSLTPTGYNSGFPAGGSGSSTAPISGTYNNANSLLGYLQNNYGQANQSNGNYTVNGFRMSDSLAKAVPAAAQFNALMNAGKVNDAYSMLSTGNQAGTQLLKSALQGDPQFMGQIINTFAKGGTNAYFGPQYHNAYYAPQVDGHFDNSGNWVNGGQTLEQMLQSGAITQAAYNHETGVKGAKGGK